MWGSHPGARAPGRELPALRAYCAVTDATSRGKSNKSIQIVVDRSAIITLVNSPSGTEALCRGCKSPDGSVISHQFSGSVSRRSRETEPEN
ncbi:hypothetical protein LF1_10070 [Rubripirellula obstinata]|uniref:Uncharacterized protein n=1 Tax=Rubripirellula obstinata TaxID=406547 RepID=A0A5B1CBK7_9BACT|nr:hypothetical protein LF1_10070 [Rubripirellula obstinata]